MTNYPLILVVAIDQNHAIGAGGTLPWYAPKDLATFQHITTDNPVIMGRSTWHSLRYNGLKNRTSIVLSKKYNSVKETTNYLPAHSIDNAIALAQDAVSQHHFMNPHPAIMIIGGGQIFKQCLELNIANEIYLSIIDLQVQNPDTFFPTSYQNQNLWSPSATVYKYTSNAPKHPHFAVHRYTNYKNTTEKQIDRREGLAFLSPHKLNSPEDRSLFSPNCPHPHNLSRPHNL